jgi:hypothetical protein
MKVYKYWLTVGDQTVTLPAGARILAVQLQHGEPQLWALVDPSQPMETRRLAMIGTGHDAPEKATYISTFQMNEGHLVVHVFEVHA